MSWLNNGPTIVGRTYFYLVTTVCPLFVICAIASDLRVAIISWWIPSTVPCIPETRPMARVHAHRIWREHQHKYWNYSHTTVWNLLLCVKYLLYLILLLFWFQCFDSKSENYLYSSNSLNNKRNFGAPTPSHYCNVSNQYLTMEVNASQPTVYCVIIIYSLFFRSRLRRRRLCMEEEEDYEDERDYDEDEVGVGIIATTRSYEHRWSRLRKRRLRTKEEE